MIINVGKEFVNLKEGWALKLYLPQVTNTLYPALIALNLTNKPNIIGMPYCHSNPFVNIYTLKRTLFKCWIKVR